MSPSAAVLAGNAIGSSTIQFFQRGTASAKATIQRAPSARAVNVSRLAPRMKAMSHSRAGASGANGSGSRSLKASARAP